MTEAELIEALADKEHASWARWMSHLFSKCEVFDDNCGYEYYVIPLELVEQWQKQIDTPYAQLSEQEKQSDRDEVAHILPIIREWHATGEDKEQMSDCKTAVEEKDKPIIPITHPYPLLIILCPSGLIFTRQAGGLACLHPQDEGILMPLPSEQESDIIRLAQQLDDIEPGCIRGPRSVPNVTVEEANQLDAAFASCNMSFSVNRARLDESMEAWLYVLIEEKDRYRPRYKEEHIDNWLQVIQTHDPHITEKKIIEVRERMEREQDDMWEMLDFFGGQEAILIWENCD